MAHAVRVVWSVKPAALDHPKVHELADKLLGLGVPVDLALIAARGLLEGLWGWTAKHCPDGRIGRYSHASIARGAGWGDLGSADALVEALVDVRLVDGWGERLAVHDWREHCAEYVHATLCRRQMRFADGHLPNLGNLAQDERARAKAWLSHPSPESSPEPRAPQEPSSSPSHQEKKISRSSFPRGPAGEEPDRLLSHPKEPLSLERILEPPDGADAHPVPIEHRTADHVLRGAMHRLEAKRRRMR